MKYHHHLALAAINILKSVFEQDRYPDKAIEVAFKAHPKWGARDRKFVAETVYEGVRWWGKIWAGLEQNPPSSGEDLPVEGYWTFLAALLTHLGGEIPEWAEFKKFDRLRFQKMVLEIPSNSAAGHSLAPWIYDQIKTELGAEADLILKALNQPAEVVLRVNRLKTQGGVEDLKLQVIKLLSSEDIHAEPIQGFPDAIRLKVRGNIFRTKAFQEGWFEVQDASSQRVAEILAPVPGERIIDACAGGGGKTLHIASLMKNKGKIIAMDLHGWKLDELKQRARRGGVDIIETRVIESSKTIKRLADTADGVLLDVPCSGLGVLRRNPDAKWKLKPERLAELQRLQSEILGGYSKMVRPGGRLVYSTCSILPSENEKQVARFLAENSSWSLLKEVRILPHLQGFDGFYIALLKRA